MTIKAFLFSCNVSGLNHSEAYKAAAPRPLVTEVVTLVAQTDNLHDPEAIQVHYNGKQIGWVPAKLGPFKGMLHRLLLANFQTYCVVERHDLEARIYERLDISIYLQAF